MPNSNNNGYLPKFAITTLQVRIIDENEGLVEFDGSINQNAGENVFFLTNIKEMSSKTIKKGTWPFQKQQTYPVFQATKVDKENFIADIQEDVTAQHSKGIFLYLHGFTINPDVCFHRLAQYNKKGGAALAIPIIWPTEGRGPLRYIVDKRTAVPGASKPLSSLLDYLYDLGNRELKVSIMCHSMGNYVLRLAAELHALSVHANKPLFEHTFHVAADVSHDIFNAEPTNTRMANTLFWNWNKVEARNELHPGLCIANLSRHKVHVLWSDRDEAMKLRVIPNMGQKALGGLGIDEKDLHPLLKDKVVCLDCSDPEDYECDPADDSHTYQFAGLAVKYYDGAMFSSSV